MGNENKNPVSGHQGDISADELLKLLNKSMDYKADEKSEKATKPSENSGESLEIDDEVFEIAQSEVKNSGTLAEDDSELDIDALIEKFINEPKKQREQEKKEELLEPETAPLEDDILQDEAADVSLAEFAESDEEILPELEVEEAVSPLESEEIIAGAVQLTVFDEMEAADEAENDSLAEAEEIQPDFEYEDDDIKIADVGGDESTCGTFADFSEDASDTVATAVFDISKVKEIAEESEPVDVLVDEAFNMCETEVFTPVHEEDIEQIPEEKVVSETVFGQDATGEIDQTDLNLMLAFGMNDKLKDTVGEEQAIAIEDDIVRQHEETVQMQAVPETVEFTSRDQISEILTKYKSSYYTLIIRIAAAAAIMGILFVFENHSLLGLTMPAFMRPTSYPVVYAMLDLQLVILCGVLVWRQLWAGVNDIKALKPTPECITVFVMGLSVIYTFIAAFTAPVSGFALYNLPVAFTVLLALIYEFMNLKRDVLSFNVVCSKRRKFVVTPVSDTTESLEREVFNDYLPDGAQIVRVGKSDFVDGFFARVNDKHITKPIIGIIAPAVVLISLAFLIITAIMGGGVYDCVTAAFMTTVFTMPLAAFMVYSYPFYKASKDAYDAGSAIIGEASLGEYSASSVISFEDKEVFPSGGVKVTSIKVYGNNRIDEIIYSLASAFMKVGGPLADVFSQATHDIGHSEDVELIEVDDDGFTVTIDDVAVHIGKASYMEKRNFDPPYDNEARQNQTSSVGILYIAYSGQLAAKVYVQYTLDAEFEAILSQLYKTGMCVGIKSFDPNIDDMLLAKKIKAMKYPVKVIRSKNVEDIPHTFERCNSGIVSKHSVKSLLRTVAKCERVSGVIKTSLIVKLLSMLIGIVVMAFVCAFGGGAALPSLYVMLYQLFWVIPVLVISRFMI